jgi:von Willebrand factor
MYDMCACKGGNANDCACPVLAAYASECSRQGTILNWRYQVAECGKHFSSNLKCKCIESLIYFSPTLPYV